MSNYITEVDKRWGDTIAYREHSEKTKYYTKDKWAAVNDGLMAIFTEFAECKGTECNTDSAEAQALVAKLQAYITTYYYNCTNAILAGLGRMYVADERFRKNIDKHGGGTAEFAAEAIAVYTKEK